MAGGGSRRWPGPVTRRSPAVVRASRRSRGRRTGAGRDTWRMPPLDELTAPRLSGGRKLGLTALRCYLLVAMILVIVRVVQIALGH